MKYAVKHIHFVGMVTASREQGSRLRDATGHERGRVSAGKFHGAAGR
jgi:hypothetical protein